MSEAGYEEVLEEVERTFGDDVLLRDRSQYVDWDGDESRRFAIERLREFSPVVLGEGPTAASCLESALMSEP